MRGMHPLPVARKQRPAAQSLAARETAAFLDLPQLLLKILSDLAGVSLGRNHTICLWSDRREGKRLRGCLLCGLLVWLRLRRRCSSRARNTENRARRSKSRRFGRIKDTCCRFIDRWRRHLGCLRKWRGSCCSEWRRYRCCRRLENIRNVGEWGRRWWRRSLFGFFRFCLRRCPEYWGTKYRRRLLMRWGRRERRRLVGCHRSLLGRRKQGGERVRGGGMCSWVSSRSSCRRKQCRKWL